MLLQKEPMNGTSADSSSLSSQITSKDTAKEELPEVMGQFSNFNISTDTIKCLKKKGVEYLFPIQIKTFDHIYNGKDVIGQASKFLCLLFSICCIIGFV